MSVVFGNGTWTRLLESNVSITATTGEYQDTGLFIVLPSTAEPFPDPGLPFHVAASVRTVFAPAAGSDDSWIVVKLVADEGSSVYDVPNSERLLIFLKDETITGENFQQHTTFVFSGIRTDTTIETTLRVYVSIHGCSAGVNFCNIQSNPDGYTTISRISG